MFRKLYNRNFKSYDTFKGIKTVLFSSVQSTEKYTLAEAFEIVCRSRCSQRGNFSSERVANAKLKKVLELTQLAPSSFNIQPYKMIVVRSDDGKEALSTCMLGSGNVRKVLQAPVSVVFLSDKDPTRSVRKLMKLESDHGADAAYVSSLPSIMSLLHGKGFVSTKLRSLIMHIASPLQPSPRIQSSAEIWSVKNTTFFMQQMLLAATSVGLSTAPMEGFDELRVCYNFDIPEDEYAVALVISMGYSVDSSAQSVAIQGGEIKLGHTYIAGYEHCSKAKPQTESNTSCAMFPFKPRFSLKDMCYGEKFGESITLE